MVIGVDAGSICETDERLKVGVYRVTLELLKNLAHLDTVNAYRLYSYAPISKTLLTMFGNTMVNVVLSPSIGYMKFRLSLQLRLHPSDIFLGLSQAVPIGAHNAIGFVYDLGFLSHPEEYGTSAERLKRQTDEVLSRSRHIITISNASKRDIMRVYHIDEKRITVCYPGVSEAFLSPGEEYHESHPYFLSVGLLKPGKHIPAAIRAFSAYIQTVNTPYDFLIAGGDTNLDQEIKAVIRELHLEKRVKLLGFVPDEALAQLYRGAEALVALSMHEGFCLPAVESLACGCPVIYANAGALPEIVGEAGIAVTEEKIDTIVAAMQEIQKKKSERRKRAFVQAKWYQWNNFAREVLQVISDVSKGNTR